MAVVVVAAEWWWWQGCGSRYESEVFPEPATSCIRHRNLQLHFSVILPSSPFTSIFTISILSVMVAGRVMYGMVVRRTVDDDQRDD